DQQPTPGETRGVANLDAGNGPESVGLCGDELAQGLNAVKQSARIGCLDQDLLAGCSKMIGLRTGHFPGRDEGQANSARAFDGLDPKALRQESRRGFRRSPALYFRSCTEFDLA